MGLHQNAPTSILLLTPFSKTLSFRSLNLQSVSMDAFLKNGRDSVRRYLFGLAVLMSLSLASQGRCQGMSSAGNTVSGGQLTFKPVDISRSAAPISTVGLKNSQGSKF